MQMVSQADEGGVRLTVLFGTPERADAHGEVGANDGDGNTREQ